MKKMLHLLLCLMLCIACIPNVTLAHSGRTDSSGGHHDNKNKSGLGSYHYHCGGYPAHLHDDGYCPYTDVLPSSVSVKAKKSTLGIGETTTIAASVSPSNAVDTSVDWSNSNPDVVELDEHEGTIKAIGYGTSTITATAINGKKTSIKIVVQEIKADKVQIQEKIETMNIGDTYELTAEVFPENVDDPTITWKSSDEKIAKVDQNGKIEAIAEGTVTISAVAKNGVKDSREIEVKEVIAEKIEILLEEDVIHRKTAVAKVEFYPENTTFQEIEWKVADENIAQVDDEGVIKGINVGKTTLTAIQKDTEATIEVEVLPLKVEQINITSTIDGKVYLGSTADFSAEITPSNATYPEVYWKVEDESIATIDEEGHLKADGLGSTVVIAYTEDGCEARYELEVAVPPVVVAGSVGMVGMIGVGMMMKKRKKGAEVKIDTN